MLSNEDLAELLESTRDRVQHMGGDAPAAVGVTRALDGLITMLRDQVQADEDAAQPTYVNPVDDVEPEAKPEAEPEPEPPVQQRRQIPVRLRRQQEEHKKPDNPLLSEQYAGFFNKLIADQKMPDAPRPAADEGAGNANAADDEPAEAPPQAPRRAAPKPSQPPQQSSVPAQYRGFFDALVRDQKGEAPPQEQHHDDDADAPVAEVSGNGEAAPPPPEEKPPRGPAMWRDETSTG
jgi:hypothetical protein